MLTQGSGASSFQQACGSIRLVVDGPFVTLSAYCKANSGAFLATSLLLNNINNNNGNLVQQ